MKFIRKSFLVAVVFGLVTAESNPENDDSQREKRDFVGIPHGGHIGVRRGYHIGGHSAGHDVAHHAAAHATAAVAGLKGAAKSAALAAAKHVAAASAASQTAHVAASLKRSKAAHISNAAHAAQAVVYDESYLAGKTTSAVIAAESTYNIADSLIYKIRDALSEAEAVAAQAWKSLDGAKDVKATQSAMVYKAQRAADTLSKQQYLSLSELQAAQAAASKAFAIAKSKGDGVYGVGVHGEY